MPAERLWIHARSGASASTGSSARRPIEQTSSASGFGAASNSAALAP